MSRAARKGLFDPSTPVRGPGVWRTAKNDLVVHAGDALAVLAPEDCLKIADSKAALDWQSAGQVIDNGLYAAAPRCLRPALKPASRAAGNRLLAGLRLWTYDDKRAADMVLGFIGASYLGGAPAWRVHLLISAQGGSGKTWLMNFIEAALGGMGAYANDFTEAGIRQSLTGESRVLLLDEAEGEDGTISKVQSVIQLLRRMSSGGGANVMRGSSSGRAQNFQLTGCAAMAAILPPPLKPQDRSRICQINVVRPASGDHAAAAAERATAAIAEMRDLAPGFRMRALAGWPRFLDTFAAYRATLVGSGLSGRNADTLATLLAGRDLLLNDEMPDADSIAQDVEHFAPFMAAAEEAEDEGEGQQCLTHLLSSPFDRWRDGERATIAEMMIDRRADLLGRIGIKLVKLDEGGGLLIANRHVGLNRIFEGSNWSDGRWVTALRYLEGAKPLTDPTRFAGVLARATFLPQLYMPRNEIVKEAA
jgi:hypothetical protein